MPKFFLFNLYPIVSAESSIIFNLYFFVKKKIFFQSGTLPNKFGIIIAFVFLFIAFFIWSMLATKVFLPTSIKWGFKPSWYIGATVVENVKVVVMISLPH